MTRASIEKRCPKYRPSTTANFGWPRTWWMIFLSHTYIRESTLSRSSTGAHLRTYSCTTHVRVTVRSNFNHRVRLYASMYVCVCARIWGHAAPDTLASTIPWIISGANELFRSSLLSSRLHCTEISVRFSLSALIISRPVRRVTSPHFILCTSKSEYFKCGPRISKLNYRRYCWNA